VSRLIAHGEPPVYFTFPGLARAGLAHATTTRHCPGLGARRRGDAPFGDETRAALAPAGLDLTRVAWARQVHGADVARVGAAAGFAGPGDVLVTRERGVSLAIVTADCLALTLWDAEHGVLAMAHAGWRGTARGAAQAAVAALRAAGGDPARVRAAISPSIGPCCYEIDAPVVDAFRSAYPTRWERWLRPGRPDHWMLDLWAAAEDLLESSGVPRSRIEHARLCTACNPGLLYSYRKGHRGRLVTLAALP
jgi:YfiH family protein